MHNQHGKASSVVTTPSAVPGVHSYMAWESGDMISSPIITVYLNHGYTGQVSWIQRVVHMHISPSHFTGMNACEVGNDTSVYQALAMTQM